MAAGSLVATIPSVKELEKPRTAHLKASGIFPDVTTRAWTAFNNELLKDGQSRNVDHEFWWHTTGLTFAILLEKAQYSLDDQRRYLSLYYSDIIPSLGVGPDIDGTPKHWKSFMTDHFCPVEFSWEWSKTDETPTIRFSLEPIGPKAGTPEDPVNSQATSAFVGKHATEIPGCDLEWHNYFWENLISSATPKTKNLRRASAIEADKATYKSRSFLALDLNESSMVLKAYYLPSFKACERDMSGPALITEAIDGLPNKTDAFQASYGNLLKFLWSCPEGRALKQEIVAIDCLPPEKTRLKIYMRNPSTCLRSVVNTLTMRDPATREQKKKGVAEFCKLWNTVFDLQCDEESEEELPLSTHRTGGMLYYFELRPDRPEPQVKVYLPVRHYGASDRDTARRLQSYMRTTSRADHSERYIEALEDIRQVHSL